MIFTPQKKNKKQKKLYSAVGVTIWAQFCKGRNIIGKSALQKKNRNFNVFYWTLREKTSKKVPIFNLMTKDVEFYIKLENNYRIEDVYRLLQKVTIWIDPL